jgi:acetyl-CoA carboxylase/biotin carboxylase 1
VRGGKKAGWTGVRDALRVMPPEERDEILKYLRD